MMKRNVCLNSLLWSYWLLGSVRYTRVADRGGFKWSITNGPRVDP